MSIAPKRPRPIPWNDRKKKIGNSWLKPYFAVEHLCEWVIHLMSGWVFVETLEYLGKFSVLIAVIFYFAESGDRRKQKHYQAWQVINTAQGKGGSGGRIDALQDLNHDHIPLVGVDLGGAFLQGLQLPKGVLARADLHGADLRNCVLLQANLNFAILHSANLRDCNLQKANFEDADLAQADLNGANLSQSKLTRSNLEEADLRQSDWNGTDWRAISRIQFANIHGIRNAPPGFLAWAKQNGAVDLESDDAWEAQLKQ